MSDKLYVKIKELPESNQINPSDYIIIDNELDTWKVPVSVFTNIINNALDELKETFDNDIAAKMTQFEALITDALKQLDDVPNKLREIEQAESLRVDAENSRVDAENARAQAEVDRDNHMTEIDDTVASWKVNLDSVIAAIEQAERNRVSAENARVQAETNRVTGWTQIQNSYNSAAEAELARATAESQRQTKIDAIVAAEAERVRSESSRATSFNAMVDYFDDVRESINNCRREGVSKPTTASARVTSILVGQVPSTDFDYEALLHITDGTNEAFIAVDLDFTSNPRKLYMCIPRRYSSNFAISDFTSLCGTPAADGRTSFRLEYKARVNAKIKTSIVWDNITYYHSDSIPVYAMVPNNETPVGSFRTAGVISIVNGQRSNMAQGLVNILNSLEDLVSSAITDIKPYEMFPVGSIYETVLNSNPSTILGGGTWKLLYGGGIKEKIVDASGAEKYSPTIYKWERTK